MVGINCTIYEKCDFIEFLEYAKQKKIQDYENKKISKKLLDYELERIERLVERIKGKCTTDYEMVSRKYSMKHPSGYVDHDDLPKPDGHGSWRWS